VTEWVWRYGKVLISELISGYEYIWANMDMFGILKLVLGFLKLLGNSGFLAPKIKGNM